MVVALAVADTDSYLKWGAAVLDALPAEWSVRLVLIANPRGPSERQVSIGTVGSRVSAGTVRSYELPDLLDEIERLKPDLLVLATLGPVAAIVARAVVRMPGRPVIASGLPGIGIPATRKALIYRSQADLMLVHSRRERREFGAVASALPGAPRLVLATLPFVPRQAQRDSGQDVVFAAQALVPAELAERERVVDALIALARAQPRRRIVVKVRAVSGEQQTHPELHGYEELLAARSGVPVNLVVRSGAMTDALDQAGALVTVSSTAALEALARHLPVIAIDDFGVGPDQINEIFVDSGLLAPLSELAAGRFRAVEPRWLDDNYFHDPGENDWLRAVTELLMVRAAEGLPVRSAARTVVGGALGLAWQRKRVLGRYDRSRMGRTALLVGFAARPLWRLGRMVVRLGGSARSAGASAAAASAPIR